MMPSICQTGNLLSDVLEEKHGTHDKESRTAILCMKFIT